VAVRLISKRGVPWRSELSIDVGVGSCLVGSGCSTVPPPPPKRRSVRRRSSFSSSASFARTVRARLAAFCSSSCFSSTVVDDSLAWAFSRGDEKMGLLPSFLSVFLLFFFVLGLDFLDLDDDGVLVLALITSVLEFIPAAPARFSLLLTIIMVVCFTTSFFRYSLIYIYLFIYLFISTATTLLYILSYLYQ